MSNQVYQRPLSEGHIISAVKDFDVYQINPVKVSRRNGINYVFDGQHTIEIVASRSGSRDTPVWCIGTLSITHISYNHKVSHIAQLLIFSVTAMIPLLAVLTWVVFRLNGNYSVDHGAQGRGRTSPPPAGAPPLIGEAI